MNHQYSRMVNNVLLAATLLAITLFLIKFLAWWNTGSVSMLAGLVDSLLDIAASITNLLIVRYSLQPADEEHTFGHGKAESLAALTQSMFVAGSALFLVLTGIHHLAKPTTTMQYPIFGIIIAFLALIFTLILVIFQQWVIYKTYSQAVQASMIHYKSDILVYGAIITALLLSSYGLKWADALFALLIGIWILYSALKMGYQAIQSLLDRALPNEEIEKIINLVTSWPGVIGIHKLRTRQSGQTRFIQLHLEMDDYLTLIQVHHITTQVEQTLLKHFPNSDIIIRQDPYLVISRDQINTLINK
ncbi:MAG: CDF family cation-efflux transporter FieF [Candidatus Dasytiphilus stammeri]